MLRLTRPAPAVGERIRILRDLLRPYAAVDCHKTRIGGCSDGGYVMIDDFAAVETAISIGIGSDVSWDRDLADRGILIYQFDYSIPGPPALHTNFRFEQTRVDATKLARILLRMERHKGVLLKIDIEHEEWAVLRDVPARAIARCAQIVCELHWFRRVVEIEWFRNANAVLARLNRWFRVVHLHANNWQPLIGERGIAPFGERPEGIMLPDVLEVTYANRQLYQLAPSDEIFPTALDYPNNPAREDHILGKF